MKIWKPSNRIIKGTGWHYCNNDGCMAIAAYAFDDGEAVWCACAACLPDEARATAVRLKQAAPGGDPASPAATPDKGVGQ